MKKILVLTSTFPKNENDKVPTFVKDQITNLKKKYLDIEFLVVVPEVPDGLKNTQSKYFKEIRFHYFWPFRFEKLVGRGIIPSIKENKLRFLLIPFYIVSQIITLLSVIKKERPSLIYAHWFTPQAISCYVASFFYDIPFVFTTHAQDVIIMKKIPVLGKFIAKKIIKKSKAWTCDSLSTEERLINTIGRENFQKDKSLVIPMAVDANSYEEIQELNYPKYSHLEKQFNILFIGRFAEIKGVEYLINTFSKIYQEFPHANLILGGDGPLRDKYSHLISELKIPKNRIIFTGYVDKGLKKYLFNIAKLVIIPSILSDTGHREGMPVVLLESLYFGKMTMASKYCNAEDVIINSNNGYIFDPLEEVNFLETVKTIANLNQEAFTKIEKNAKKIGSSFTDKNLTEKYYSHLFKNYI